MYSHFEALDRFIWKEETFAAERVRAKKALSNKENSAPCLEYSVCKGYWEGWRGTALEKSELFFWLGVI